MTIPKGVCRMALSAKLAPRCDGGYDVQTRNDGDGNRSPGREELYSPHRRQRLEGGSSQQMTRIDDLGRWGEAEAEKYLRGHGYATLERNWHCREGELDLVMERGDEIVFVEVKTRSGREFGLPEEAITKEKGRRLQRAAWRYLSEVDRLDDPWSIDVIAIERGDEGEIRRLDHYANAVEATEL